MSRKLHRPGVDPNLLTVPIKQGGTGARDVPTAKVNLDLLTNDMLNQPNGAAGLDANNHILLSAIPSGITFASTKIEGPSLVSVGQRAEYTITDYDQYTTYTVTASDGVAVRSGDTVYYKAPMTPGNYTLTINSKVINITVDDRYISKPSVLAPLEGIENVGNAFQVLTSDFKVEQGFPESTLSASDKAANDYYGTAIAITADGLRLAVGAYGKDSGAGAVYHYTWNGTAWVQESIMQAADKVAGDKFGGGIALSADGTRLAVGAYGKTVSGLIGAGQVYHYTRSGSVWTLESVLSASDKATTDAFGVSMTLSADGTRLAVGAPNRNSGGLNNSGAVYTYTRSGTVWTQEAILTASDKAANDAFGISVSFNSDATRLAVGAYARDSNSVIDSGAVYHFARSGSVWTQESILTASDKTTNDFFGSDVALSADGMRLVIGAYGSTVASLAYAGKFYVYNRVDTAWVLETTMTASDAGYAEYFAGGLAATPDLSKIVTSSVYKNIAGLYHCGQVYEYNMSYQASTNWQLSDKADFSNIVQQSLADTVNLKSWTITGLNLGQDYFVRCRYNGTQYGTSEWSDVRHFKTRSSWLPTNEMQVLSASNKATNDEFGMSIAMSADGTRLVIGASQSSIGNGKAYIFVKSGNTWVQEAQLVASDPASNDRFGWAVDITSDGSRVVIGAYLKTVSAVTGAGAVYVFSRSGTVWTQEQKLTVTAPGTTAYLGYSVIISRDGSKIVAGCPCFNDGTTLFAGTAYVFTRSGSVWSQAQKLSTTNAGTRPADGNFGNICMTPDGSRIIIGVPHVTLSAVSQAGGVYVLTWNGSSYVLEATITASDRAANDEFGTCVTVSDDGSRIAVGAVNKTVSALAQAGKVYVYTRSGTTWTEEAQITVSDKAANDWFGHAVLFNSDASILLVGNYGADMAGMSNVGSFTAYTRNGSVWTEGSKVSASDKAAGAAFGHDLSASADFSTLAVSARFGTVGGISQCGSTYIFN